MKKEIKERWEKLIIHPHWINSTDIDYLMKTYDINVAEDYLIKYEIDKLFSCNHINVKTI